MLSSCNKNFGDMSHISVIIQGPALLSRHFLRTNTRNNESYD